MPPTTNSTAGNPTSSFFGRFTNKRQVQEVAVQPAPSVPNATRSIPSPPLSSLSNAPTRSATPPLHAGVLTNADGSPARKQAHKRESSFTSLTNTVSDLGSNVKRSVSLRSHRTLGSAGSGGVEVSRPGSRYQARSPPVISPIERTESNPERLTREPPTPPRSRGRLALATRSLSQRFKSSEHLPIQSSPEKMNAESQPPPIPSLDDLKLAMLTNVNSAPVANTKRTAERPVPSLQPSFTREMSNSFAGINGNIMPHISGSGSSQNTDYHVILSTARKRIQTIQYMRKVHDGNVFYFNTLHYSMGALSQMPSLAQHRLGRRATTYMVLGFSLPGVLDMNAGSPLEYLKALSALLQEFETYQTLVGFDSSGQSIGRGRMGQMFKSGMGLGNRTGRGRRSSTATDFSIDSHKTSLTVPLSASDTGSPQDMPSPVNPIGHDFNLLITPHLPFDPDFSTTFATLCDTLVDAYSKILELLPSPELCSAGVSDAFSKADKAVRKILVANVAREFEDTTRATVRGEVAGLGKLVLGGLM